MGCLVDEQLAGARLQIGEEPRDGDAGELGGGELVLDDARDRVSGHLRAEDVLAAAGDQPIVDAAASALGRELARLVNALDPEAVVIGGGLGLAPGFRERIEENMRPDIYADLTRDLPVLPAALGVRAGVIGAALAAEAGQALGSKG